MCLFNTSSTFLSQICSICLIIQTQSLRQTTNELRCSSNSCANVRPNYNGLCHKFQYILFKEEKKLIKNLIGNDVIR